MRELIPLGEKIGALLRARKQTVAVAESAAGLKLDGRKLQDTLMARAGKTVGKIKVPVEVRDKTGKFIGIDNMLLKDAPIQAWQGAVLTLLSLAPNTFPQDTIKAFLQAVSPANTPEHIER